MKYNITSFSGHEKFECKASWLPMAYRNDKVMREDIETAMALMGIGSNKVKSLRQWVYKFNIYDGKKFSDQAHMIFLNDPYLEKPDSLWILHSFLTQNISKATLYYLFFNQFFLSSFTKESLLHKIRQWCDEHKIKISTNTLKYDVEVFIRMYLKNDEKDNFLANIFHDLNILQKNDDELIVNIKNPVTLSDEAFLYIFLYFIRDQKGETVSLKDLQYGQNSLQYTLCLTEEKFLEKIEKLNALTNNQVFYQEASGIKQIYINKKPALELALSQVYEKGVK